MPGGRDVGAVRRPVSVEGKWIMGRQARSQGEGGWGLTPPEKPPQKIMGLPLAVLADFNH